MYGCNDNSSLCSSPLIRIRAESLFSLLFEDSALRTRSVINDHANLKTTVITGSFHDVKGQRGQRLCNIFTVSS